MVYRHPLSSIQHPLEDPGIHLLHWAHIQDTQNNPHPFVTSSHVFSGLTSLDQRIAFASTGGVSSLGVGGCFVKCHPFLDFPWGVDTSRLMWQHWFSIFLWNICWRDFFFPTWKKHPNVEWESEYSELRTVFFLIVFFFNHRKKTSQQNPHRQVWRTFLHRRLLKRNGAFWGKLRVVKGSEVKN